MNIIELNNTTFKSLSFEIKQKTKDQIVGLRPVCVSNGVHCENCYTFGAPCIVCDSNGLDISSSMSWHEFMTKTCNLLTYEQFCKKPNSIK